MKSYSVTIVHGEDRRTTIEFTPYSYRNLMELIVNELMEDIGACRGKAWCGTCHVTILKGQLSREPMITDETETLKKLTATQNSHLACQLMVDESLDGITFKILGDN